MERNYSKESRKEQQGIIEKKEKLSGPLLIPACPAAVLHNVLLVPAVARTDDDGRGPSGRQRQEATSYFDRKGKKNKVHH